MGVSLAAQTRDYSCVIKKAGRLQNHEFSGLLPLLNQNVSSLAPRFGCLDMFRKSLHPSRGQTTPIVDVSLMG